MTIPKTILLEVRNTKTRKTYVFSFHNKEQRDAVMICLPKEYTCGMQTDIPIRNAREAMEILINER